MHSLNAVRIINSAVFKHLEKILLSGISATRIQATYYTSESRGSDAGLNVDQAGPKELQTLASAMQDVRRQIFFLAAVRAAASRNDQELGRVALLHHFGALDPEMGITLHVIENHVPTAGTAPRPAVLFYAGGSALGQPISNSDPIDAADTTALFVQLAKEYRWTELYLEINPTPEIT
jgi:hypothetical protein